MNKFRFPILALVLLVSSISNAQKAQERENLYQISTFNALLQGVYDGSLTVGSLLQHGDMGIGTFNRLDGEMIVMDGKCYQVDITGKVRVVPANVTTPYACVTHFDTDVTIKIDKPTSLQDLEIQIDKLIKSKNHIAAIRIAGQFEYVKTRSVPKQSPPYQALAEAVKQQAVFMLNKTQGELVGFWCPQWLNGIAVPGYHIHYLDQKKSAGGHVLDCVMTKGVVRLDITPNISLNTPMDKPFVDAELVTDRSKETKAVEKGK